MYIYIYCLSIPSQNVHFYIFDVSANRALL